MLRETYFRIGVMGIWGTLLIAPLMASLPPGSLGTTRFGVGLYTGSGVGLEVRAPFAAAWEGVIRVERPRDFAPPEAFRVVWAEARRRHPELFPPLQPNPDVVIMGLFPQNLSKWYFPLGVGVECRRYWNLAEDANAFFSGIKGQVALHGGVLYQYWGRLRYGVVELSYTWPPVFLADGEVLFHRVRVVGGAGMAWQLVGPLQGFFDAEIGVGMWPTPLLGVLSSRIRIGLRWYRDAAHSSANPLLAP